MQAARIHPEDNVAVVLSNVPAGTSVRLPGLSIRATEHVPIGHKIAISDICELDAVVKYGESIGHATTHIAPGRHVHTHNTATNLDGHMHYCHEPADGNRGRVSRAPSTGYTFGGYRRDDGSVGTRNELWILVTVGCVNRLAQRLAVVANEKYANEIDGVHALPHPFGCSQTGEDRERTKRLLTALCCHPNAAVLLLISLGCETNAADEILEAIPAERAARIRHLRCQQAVDEYQEGLRLISELVSLAATDRRTSCGLADLTIGLKCGGSDALSGLTANPLTGRIADLVTSDGGRALLSEVPEMFGAEHLLLNRASSPDVHRRIVSLIEDFRNYYLLNGESIAENPSPGNIAGGITTLEEKSLGAIQKGGRTPITEVCRYAEKAAERGLVLVEAPGNDAVSCTALVAAGANIVLFTTGRGTPLGPPVPTLKIASNTTLAQAKANWIDFDAGRMLSHEDPDALRDELMELILAAAAGRYRTSAERNDQREIAIWKTGVTL